MTVTEVITYDDAPVINPRDLGYRDARAGRNEPYVGYDRTQRAEYFQGHIRGTLDAVREERMAARSDKGRPAK